MAGPTTFPKHGPTHSVGSIGNHNSGGFPSVPKANPGAARPGKPPYPHIDDIVSVDVDIDHNAPVEKLLQTAETYLRQAESARSFGRPDLALKDYIRTNILVVDYIKKNKGWVSLQADNKAGLARYQQLLRRIHALSDEFERIKADIKADNATSHVQPTARRPPAGGEPTDARKTQLATQAQSLQNGTATGHAVMNGGASPRKQNGFGHPPVSSPKSKPAVQPKPQALHGNALVRNEDLAQRFARLRTNAATAQAGQDSRIRTQAIMAPDSPKAASIQAPRLENARPPPYFTAGLPRLPDAIYNPVRGTVSTEAAELPSSAPRAIFTRTNSASVVPTTKPVTVPLLDEEYRPSQSFKNAPASLKRSRPTIPGGETISAEDLVRYMRMGAKQVSILLIDIRTRELFDEGHIMSQATICVEAEVLIRSDISANEIADSMILAPAAEQLLFEKRHEFDMVVFYDQDSLRITGKMDTPEQKAISGLYNALIHYDFPGLPSNQMKPKLLQGGLDAWTGIVGVSGLQTSSTSASSTTAPMARSFLNRRQTYVARPIQDADEVKRWEETLSDMVPVRTKEDFLRRLVPAGPTQESMVQPPLHAPIEGLQSPFRPRMSHEEIVYSTMPPPPARPPPALPRRSYSGLAETESPSSTLAMRMSLVPSAERVRRYRTGFVNPGVHCFANSSLQAMFATPGFARELWSGSWQGPYKDPPRKATETMANPQLLVKALANVFLLLNNGEVPSLSTRYLMGYIHRLHKFSQDGRKKREEDVFGGNHQQDAQEFYSFIIDNIHDETNMLRNLIPPKEEITYSPTDGTIIQNAIDAWNRYSRTNASIIDRYFRGLDVFKTTCKNPACGLEQRRFQPFDVRIVTVPSEPNDTDSNDTDLLTLLKRNQRGEHVDSTCERCNKSGRLHQVQFARLPDRLAFCIGRFGGWDGSKLATKISFPIQTLDLTSCMAEPDLANKTGADGHFAGSMVYDCYAVTVHSGFSVKSGHYYTYVQDDQSKNWTDWWRCDDEYTERVKIGSSAKDDQTEAMYQKTPAAAYMVYYRRRGT